MLLLYTLLLQLFFQVVVPFKFLKRKQKNTSELQVSLVLSYRYRHFLLVKLMTYLLKSSVMFIVCLQVDGVFSVPGVGNVVGGRCHR